jgi:hypothetical protein
MQTFSDIIFIIISCLILFTLSDILKRVESILKTMNNFEFETEEVKEEIKSVISANNYTIKTDGGTVVPLSNFSEKKENDITIIDD